MVHVAGIERHQLTDVNARPIDMLTDDVLLDVFDFYVKGCSNRLLSPKDKLEEWQILVHVCRRWRGVVFGSPRRLNLRLCCTPDTPARDTLDVWPSLPLVIGDSHCDHRTEDVDEILAVLERSDRVVEIDLVNFDGPKWETVFAAMQMSFPELTYVRLYGKSVLPESFLGGSAPRLKFLELIRISYPGIPKLLLSATHLVTLRLLNIPHSGYISPDAIVTVLSTLATGSLKHLTLEFKSPRSRPDWENRRLPPPTRSVLPSLTVFGFKGVCEYLEDVVTRIHAPRLNVLYITLFNQIVFDAPQFIQFVSRSPTLETYEKALVIFGNDATGVYLASQTSRYGNFNIGIPCIELDWQVSSMEQVCTWCLPPLFTLEDLYIHEDPYLAPVWKDNIEDTLWLELLRPFTGVKNLYLSEKLASHIIPALKEFSGGRTTEVLPTLHNIFLEELQSSTVQAGTQQFVATRQVTGHLIALSRWENSKQVIRNNSDLHHPFY